jgi:hypothetical protein
VLKARDVSGAVELHPFSIGVRIKERHILVFVDDPESNPLPKKGDFLVQGR